MWGQNTTYGCILNCVTSFYLQGIHLGLIQVKRLCVCPSKSIIFSHFNARKLKIKAGNTNWGGGLSTIDLLIKVACFVKKENIIFNIKMSWSKQGGTRRPISFRAPSWIRRLEWFVQTFRQLKDFLLLQLESSGQSLSSVHFDRRKSLCRRSSCHRRVRRFNVRKLK
jgi:hypothetical protein